MINEIIEAFRKTDFKENQIIAQVLLFIRNRKGTYDLCGQTKPSDINSALAAYANIPNPASQLIEAFSEKELQEKKNVMITNMLNLSYVKKYIEPYL